MSDECLSLLGVGEGFSREGRDGRIEREAKEESEVAEAAMAREKHQRIVSYLKRKSMVQRVSLLWSKQLRCTDSSLAPFGGFNNRKLEFCVV